MYAQIYFWAFNSVPLVDTMLYASTILFGLLLLCNIVWNQKVCCLQFCSFPRLHWTFEVFSCPIWILRFLKKILFIFKERGRKGEREGEKHWYVRETSIGCLSYTLYLDTEPTTQAYALTRNTTSNLCFLGRCLTNLATLARARIFFLFLWKMPLLLWKRLYWIYRLW